MSSFLALLTKTVLFIAPILLLVGFIVFLGSWTREELEYAWEKLAGIEYSADYSSYFPPAGKRILSPVSGFSLIAPTIGVSKRLTKSSLGGAESVIEQENIAFIQESSFPGEHGTTFLVAHTPPFTIHSMKRNPDMYLFRYLDEEDGLFITFEGKKYQYRVTQKAIVDKFPEIPSIQQEDVLFIVTANPFSDSFTTILAKMVYVQE